MKSVVLLSGGLDSTVNLFEALKAGEIKLALTFDYGQRAREKELKSAQNLAQHIGVPHLVLELPFFKTWGHSSLIDQSRSVPTGSAVRIDDKKISEKTAESVWVPNRNGVFLNIAAGFAEALGADTIIPGFNAEEAATFPDNSEDFLKAMDQSLFFSTNKKVRTHCFTTKFSKSEIVKRGIELHVPFEKIWPCYFSNENWCGECESCQRSKRAFIANGLEFSK